MGVLWKSRLLQVAPSRSCRHFNYNAPAWHSRTTAATNPQIYMSWGSNCDLGAYHGWVMKYTVSQSQLSTTPAAYFVTTPTGTLGGIWGAGAALAADNSVNGNLYIASGNGTADGSANFGESVLKLSSNLSLLDWYTPNNAKCLNGIKADSPNCPGNEDLGCWRHGSV